MILQTARALNLLPGALILAIWGAIVDWRYKRKGGKKPSKKDRLLFLTALALVAAFFGAIAVSGIEDVAGALGAASADFSIVLFATWELGRWRVRRKYPLSTKESVPAQPHAFLRCSGCGRESDPLARFCSNCGKSITGQAD
jgi:hypothetical protein